MKARTLLLPLFLVATSAVFAQQAGAPGPGQPNQSNASPQAEVSAPPAPAPSSSRDRAVSPGLAAALAERMPRYSPPPPPRQPSEEEEEEAQPRNRIVRLPQVVVEGTRPPVFTDRELHTDKGMAELAVRRYLSELDRGVLNRYTLPLFGQSNEQRALAAYAEEERLRNISDANDSVRMIRATEGEDAAEDFRDTANATFIRTPYLPEPTSLNRD